MSKITTTIIATQKNEGMFLVEWIAHHLAIGFDHIVIATNDCEDGSDHLLDAIGQHFPVTRIENSTLLPDMTIQQSATTRCLAHPVAQSSTWVTHIDVDEFINFPDPADALKPYLEEHAKADAIALTWRIFGDAGRAHWDGGLVTEAFLQAQAIDQADGVTAHKTIFRPDVFGMTTPHMPKQPQKPPEALRVINSRGDVLGSAPHFSQRNSAYKLDPALMSWDRVYINHYAVKSRDLVELKQRRGDANGRRAKHRQPGHPQFEAWNRNTVQDASILATRAARTAKINEMLAQPEILAGHLQGLRWFLDKKQPGA